MKKNNIWCHNNLQIIINYSFSLNILEPFRTLLFIDLCVVLDDKQVCKKSVLKKKLIKYKNGLLTDSSFSSSFSFILMYVVPWFLCDVNSFSHHIQTKWKVLKKTLAF